MGSRLGRKGVFSLVTDAMYLPCAVANPLCAFHCREQRARESQPASTDITSGTRSIPERDRELCPSKTAKETGSFNTHQSQQREVNDTHENSRRTTNAHMFSQRTPHGPANEHQFRPIYLGAEGCAGVPPHHRISSYAFSVRTRSLAPRGEGATRVAASDRATEKVTPRDSRTRRNQKGVTQNK